MFLEGCVQNKSIFMLHATCIGVSRDTANYNIYSRGRILFKTMRNVIKKKKVKNLQVTKTVRNFLNSCGTISL